MIVRKEKEPAPSKTKAGTSTSPDPTKQNATEKVVTKTTTDGKCLSCGQQV